MDQKIIQLVDKFPVITAAKEIYEIFVFQEFFFYDAFGCIPQKIPGRKFYSTADKRKVNMIDENTFEIIGDSNVIATRA